MKRSGPRIAGLYAITPDEADTSRLLTMVAAACEGGASLVQYRNKSANDALRADQATQLARLCREYRRPLIVNDHADLAMTIEGAGLHVGAEDVDDLHVLRQRLGAERILGVSCYASVERAKDAAHAGADYLAFGSVFPSATKPAAVRAPLDLFARVRALGVALVGIGGIDASNLPRLIDAGADAAAVIAALFEASDERPDFAAIRDRATALARCFPQAPDATRVPGPTRTHPSWTSTP